MYTSFFGLTTEPFRTTPDPSMLYLTTSHREALAGLSYAILTHKGFAVLTGEVGTGKTTLVSRIVQSVPASKAVFSVILNSALTSSEFLETVLLDFGLEDIPASKAQRLQRLHKFLISQHEQGRTCVLVVDEAQKLSEEVLEEVRLLSNCELPDEKLLQIVLSGQPELEDLLERQAIRQLKQRVSVWLRIGKLTPQEVAEYIRFRWMKAGGSEAGGFEAAAIAAVAECSEGIPRLVNVLCDHSLVLAFCESAHLVMPKHVMEAAQELVLGAAAGDPRSDVKSSDVRASPAAGQQDEMPGYAIPEPMPTLRRYGAASTEKSWLWRWAAKFSGAPHPDRVI
jgi:general secretion pathway protein A